jgi:adenine-specific DNA-methyltransferase
VTFEDVMKKLTAKDPETHSADVLASNIEQLKALFPEVATEGGIDFEGLKQLLGGAVDEREEKYGLNWHGKRRARQLALTPSNGTLRPCPEDSVDWDTTQHLMIEGDNLEVLKLLQKSYSGKVKLIYIDPPYNTGKDFVYPDKYDDNLSTYLRYTGQVNDEGFKTSSNTDASGRFHTNWLNMMYPRLKAARTLLREDGVLFVSIDEKEYAHLRTICTEIFGEENLVGTLVWRNATDNNPTNIATEHEYVLVVGRGKDALEKEWKSSVSDVKDVLVRIGQELTQQFTGNALTTAYEQWFKEHKAELWPLDRYKYIDEGGVYTGSQSVHNPGREGYRYDVIHPRTKRACKQPLMGYRFPQETMNDLLARGKILFGEDETKLIELKLYASEYQEKLASVIELDGRLGAYDLKEDFPEDGKVFSNPKPVRLLNTFFPLLLRQDGDLVVDFFAGSGSTAKAVLELNGKDHVQRRFCLVQLPEPLVPEDKDQRSAVALCDKMKKPRTLAEVTKERLRRIGVKHKDQHPTHPGDLGFRVFKLDSSNIRAWEPDRQNLPQSLLESVDHLKTDRTETDVLYELLLKLGLDLCVPIEKKTISSKEVHSIGGGVLLACLADMITRDQVEPLAEGLVSWHKMLAPAGDTMCVFRDSAFADDVAKTNLAAILNQHGLANVRSL